MGDPFSVLLGSVLSLILGVDEVHFLFSTSLWAVGLLNILPLRNQNLLYSTSQRYHPYVSGALTVKLLEAHQASTNNSFNFHLPSGPTANNVGLGFTFLFYFIVLHFGFENMLQLSVAF